MRVDDDPGARAHGVAVPAGTPAGVVNAMNAEINQVIRAPDVEPRFSQEGAAAMVVTPAEFAAFVARELKKWSEAVRVSGAKAD